jgi:hypothetical protein
MRAMSCAQGRQRVAQFHTPREHRARGTLRTCRALLVLFLRSGPLPPKPLPRRAWWYATCVKTEVWLMWLDDVTTSRTPSGSTPSTNWAAEGGWGGGAAKGARVRRGTASWQARARRARRLTPCRWCPRHPTCAWRETRGPHLAAARLWVEL